MIIALIILVRHNYIAALLLLPLFIYFINLLRNRELTLKNELKSQEFNKKYQTSTLSTIIPAGQEVEYTFLKTSAMINLPIHIMKHVIIFYLSSVFGHEKYASEDIKNINLTAQISQENDSIIRVALLEAVDQYTTKVFLFTKISDINQNNCYFSYVASKEVLIRFHLPLFLNKENIEEEIKKDGKRVEERQIAQANTTSKNEEVQEKPVEILPQVITDEPKPEDYYWDEEAKKFYQIYKKGHLYFTENYLNVNWESLCDDKKYGLVAYKYDDSQGRRTVKSVVKINKPIQEVYSYLKDLDNKGKFDSSYEKGYVQKTLNENLGLIHLQYKGKIAFSPRDFMVVVYSKLEKDSAIMFACSYPTDQSTHVKGVVRGNVVFSYYNMVKIDENTTTLELYCLSENQLSQTLVNMVLKDLAYTLREIKKLLEK